MNIKEQRYAELKTAEQKFSGLGTYLLSCTTPTFYGLGVALQYFLTEPTEEQQKLIDAGQVYIDALVAAGVDATRAISQQNVIAGKDEDTAWHKEVAASKAKRKENVKLKAPNSLEPGTRRVESNRGYPVIFVLNQGGTWQAYAEYATDNHPSTPWLVASDKDVPELKITSKTLLLKVVKALTKGYKNRSGVSGLQLALAEGFEESAGNPTEKNYRRLDKTQTEEFFARVSKLAEKVQTIEPGATNES